MNTKDVSVNALQHSKIIYWGIFFTSFLFYLLFSHLLPITDPVESNYALTAKEMVLTADWLSPKIYGNVWFDKPVFFYWLTAMAFKLFGFSDLAARLVPAIFAALGLVLMYWFMNKIAKPSVAILAMLIMGTSLEYIVLGKLIITDMVFFVCNSAALVCFYLGYSKADGTKNWYLLMYASLGLAVLTKGPVGLLLPSLVMLLFIGVKGKWAELKEMSILRGMLLFSIISLPWYIGMYAAHGTEFLNTFLGIHNYLRATVSEHPKDNVSYYYIAVFILSMFPWSFLTVKALVEVYKERRHKVSPVVTFCLIWALTYFSFYSLMATKYLTYTFPILFPLSIITAFYLEKLYLEGKARTIIYWAVIPSTLLMIIYSMVSIYFLTGIKLIISVSSFLVILLFLWWHAKKCNGKRIVGVLFLCQISCCILLSAFVLPGVVETRSGASIAEVIRDRENYRVGMYQFYSTSSVYYSGKIGVKIQRPSTDLPNQPEAGWSSKYTMPIQTLEEFMSQAKEENILIVVPDKAKNEFLAENFSRRPKLLKSNQGFSYYYFIN